jgi:hypothetical protein
MTTPAGAAPSGERTRRFNAAKNHESTLVGTVTNPAHTFRNVSREYVEEGRPANPPVGTPQAFRANHSLHTGVTPTKNVTPAMPIPYSAALHPVNVMLNHAADDIHGKFPRGDPYQNVSKFYAVKGNRPSDLVQRGKVPPLTNRHGGPTPKHAPLFSIIKAERSDPEPRHINNLAAPTNFAIGHTMNQLRSEMPGNVDFRNSFITPLPGERIQVWAGKYAPRIRQHAVLHEPVKESELHRIRLVNFK